MKERKVKHMKSNHMRQRRDRPWMLRPVIIGELLVVMIVVGMGTAFALTQNTVPTTAAPWAGTASITQSAHFAVTGYNLSYDGTFMNVSGVTIALTNSSGSTASINVVAMNNSNGVIANKLIATASYSASQNVSCPFNVSVSIASIDKLNILLSEP